MKIYIVIGGFENAPNGRFNMAHGFEVNKGVRTTEIAAEKFRESLEEEFDYVSIEEWDVTNE